MARRPIHNLKAGDLVKFVGAGPDCTQGIIARFSGEYVYLVWKSPEGSWHEIERYREEITERISEFNPVPITADRLRYLIEMAEPEDINTRMRREAAQEEIMDLLEQGQIFRTSNGVWGINPDRRM